MPLMFVPKGVSQTQFEVRAGSFAIGSVGTVMLLNAAGKAQQYRWHLTVSAAPPGFQRDGDAYSLEDANAAIEGAWQTWIASAGLLDGPDQTSNLPAKEHDKDSPNADLS